MLTHSETTEKSSDTNTHSKAGESLESQYEKIKWADVDLKLYRENTFAKPTNEEYMARLDSLSGHLARKPEVVITKNDNGDAYLLVDGSLNYEIVRQLNEKINPKIELDVEIVDNKTADAYLSTRLITKNYSGIQRGVYAVYHYWDNLSEQSKNNRKNNKNPKYDKGSTAEKISKIAGVGSTYINMIYKLLDLDRDFFYKLLYVNRQSIQNKEIKQLLNMSDTQQQKILNEMKKIFDDKVNDDTKAISEDDKNTVYRVAYNKARAFHKFF